MVEVTLLHSELLATYPHEHAGPGTAQTSVDDEAGNEVKILAVNLRDHPQMNYRGQANWPPVWFRLRAEPAKKVIGEVGVLIGSVWHAEISKRVFLRMKLDQELYMGALLLTDATFCSELHGILKQNLGRSIKEIGDLDISYTL
jgi:hypothetical protein